MTSMTAFVEDTEDRFGAPLFSRDDNREGTSGACSEAAKWSPVEIICGQVFQLQDEGEGHQNCYAKQGIWFPRKTSPPASWLYSRIDEEMEGVCWSKICTWGEKQKISDSVPGKTQSVLQRQYSDLWLGIRGDGGHGRERDSGDDSEKSNPPFGPHQPADLANQR